MALSAKNRAFIEEYLRTWNATAAARAAGYAEGSARVTGSRLLTNANIRAEISMRVAERTMTADEALIRLAEQARAEYSPYLRGDGTVDLEGLIDAGKAHLIKKTKITQWGVNVEFYDADSAKELVLKHHGMLEPGGTPDNPLHTVGWSVEEWRAQQAQRQKKAADTMAIFDEDEPGGA